jgi:anti-anti-sigma factor
MGRVAETESMSADTPSGMVTTSAGTVALEHEGRTAVIRVSGALDLALAPKLRQFVDRALRHGPELVVVDLTDVDFLASAGMATLVEANRLCRPAVGLHVVAAGRRTMRPLELTRLTDELVVFPTLSAAMVDR